MTQKKNKQNKKQKRKINRKTVKKSNVFRILIILQLSMDRWMAGRMDG